MYCMTVVVGKGIEKDVMCKLYRDEHGPNARVVLVTGGERNVEKRSSNWYNS